MASPSPAHQSDVVVRTNKAPKRYQYREGQSVALLHLSDEVLAIIAEFVGEDSQAALLHLALSSRRLHAIAEPLIYRDFCQKDYSDTGIVQFMCRIAARQDFARKVQSFHSNVTEEVDPDGTNPFDIPEEDLEQIRVVVQATSESETDAEAWVEEIENGSWDAMTALILSLSPNMRELGFEDWSRYDPLEKIPRVMKVLWRAVELQNCSDQSTSSLSNLSSVTLLWGDTKYGMDIKATVPFLSMKSVTSFEITGISCYSLEWFEPSMSFGINELTLRRSVVSHNVLTPFLRCFPSVKYLFYENGGILVSEEEFEPPRMMESLEHLKPSLEELTILGHMEGINEGLSCFPIGSFADFQKLRSMEMTISVLLGRSHNAGTNFALQFKPTQRLVEVIPPSLQSLTLRDVMEAPWLEIKEQIIELITSKQTYAPELEYLDIQWEKIKYPDKPSRLGPFIHEGFTKDEADKLLAQCEAAGVEMAMVSKPPRPKFVSYIKPGEKQANGISIPTRVSHLVPYPYTEYENLCKEHGCDPATGRRPGAPF